MQTIDNLKTYEAAIRSLSGEPDNLNQKHAAVLSLARAGSLCFAISEYERYGLDNIRHHEDIMALGGRLYKDMYLSRSGSEAKEFARKSAERYEAAFQDTGGFYSGINAATMSLLGGIPEDMVTMRAQRILDTLKGDQDEDIYFVEATRAEAYLLQGHSDKARASLQLARDYDPLNFPALASTLKQFRMIARARQENISWLTEFTPPKAVHFAGHIFGNEGEIEGVPVLSEAQVSELSEAITDLIQKHDIGFGHGALAAGSDILIAEALLAEGAEMHVVLPVSVDDFIKVSVAPFGKSWVDRFKRCMDDASSVRVFETIPGWPDSRLQQRASLMAMGGAIRQSSDLSVLAGQMLIWDGQTSGQGTAYDAQLWSKSDRPQYVLPYPGNRDNVKPGVTSPDYVYRAALHKENDDPVYFDLLGEAIEEAFKVRDAGDGKLKQQIDLELISSHNPVSNIHAGTVNMLPGAILIGELAANYLEVNHPDKYRLDFMGVGETGDQRIFALSQKG